MVQVHCSDLTILALILAAYQKHKAPLSRGAHSKAAEFLAVFCPVDPLCQVVPPAEVRIGLRLL